MTARLYVLLPKMRRLTLDVATRVARIGQAESFMQMAAAALAIVVATILPASGAEYVTAVFTAIGGKPVDLSQRAVLCDVLEKAGFNAPQLIQRASHAGIVAKLEAETKAAAERGVFGAPTMFVGQHMFFGNDRLDFVAEALRSTT
jgi:2-hydroxychromene-2-carboxylate isomerase